MFSVAKSSASGIWSSFILGSLDKEEKENEINKLKNEINRLEIMIEDSKNSYEQMLDKTTQSIQDFIKSAESKKNFQ